MSTSLRYLFVIGGIFGAQWGFEHSSEPILDRLESVLAVICIFAGLAALSHHIQYSKMAH